MVDQPEIHSSALSCHLAYRFNAVNQFRNNFAAIPDKDSAWQDLIRLTGGEDSSVRWEVANALGAAFSHVPDKDAAWQDLHRLSGDEDSSVRWEVANALGAAFSQVPDKDAAWQDLHRLSGDGYSDVRVSANHSLGKASVFKATEAEGEEDFRRELENALEFFEKSATEAKFFSNPAEFCLPFYRSFYVLTFEKEDTGAEVQKYLSEAKSASKGSKSKEELLEAIENLSSALKEAEKARDLGKMKCDLSAYKRYCDQAGELLNDTEEKAPGATKLIRKGLPVIDRRIKALLEEIRDESEKICKTAGLQEAELGCKVQKYTTSALATDNPIEVQKNVNYIVRDIYKRCNLISDAREREHIKRSLLFVQEKDTIVQLTTILDEMKRMSEKLDQINKNVNEIKIGVEVLRSMIPARFDAILSRFDKTEKIIIESIIDQILKQFDQTERNTIGSILEAIKVDSVPEALMRETLDAVQQTLAEIRQQNLVFHENLTSRDLDLFSNVVDETRLDVADQLILNVPIIPYVLSYQHQVQLQSGIKLGGAWRNLVKWVRGSR